MISMYEIKPKFQQLLRPFLDVLYKKGITANQLTLMAIILSFGIGVSLWFADDWRFGYLIVPVGLLLRMILNALDGMMARIYNMQSNLGEILNEIGDVISDMFIYIPIMAIPNVSPEIVCLFVGLSVTNEFSGIFGKVLGENRRYDGPMGKSDRALVVGTGCLVYYLHPYSSEIINYSLAICCFLMTISSFIRLKKALKDE